MLIEVRVWSFLIKVTFSFDRMNSLDLNQIDLSVKPEQPHTTLDSSTRPADTLAFSLLTLNRNLQSLLETQILQIELAQARNARLQAEILDYLAHVSNENE